MSSPFRRSLPAHPDLAQQKKLAKELLRSYTGGADEARARIRRELPDKPAITLADAQFVLAREYGFPHWTALRQHIEARVLETRSPEEQMHDAFMRCDARTVRRLFERHAELRRWINRPVFPFDAPAIVACADDPAMVEVLLDFGADPNKRSNWWAGGFHALHSATGAAAERLLAAGAIPDACAAANLDRPDLLASMIADDPACVHERGGDGQTPLHFARSRTVVDLLLAAGADIDARDQDHRATAAEWMLARERGAGRYDLARYLVERGASADVFLAAALGFTDRACALIESNPALLDGRTGRGEYAARPPSSHHIYFWTIGEGRSPLDVAAQFSQQETLDALLELVSPRHRLQLACRLGDEAMARSLLHTHPDIIESMLKDDHRAITDAAWEGNAKAVRLMLDLGFDPRTPGQDSGTALHCAAWKGSVDTVATLLRHRDARLLVTVRDARYGATPLGWCCHGSQFAHTDADYAAVARMLLEAGAQPGPDTTEASASVEAVIVAWNGTSHGAPSTI